MRGFGGVKAPELVEPGELEELLGEKKATYEVGLRGPEGEVAVVDCLHVRGRIEAVLLRGEVVNEGGRGQIAGGGEGDAHGCGVVKGVGCELGGVFAWG